MTGQGFKNSLLIKLAEAGTGFIDNTRMQDIVNTSNTNVTERKIKQFQLDQIVTEEISPLKTITGTLTPVNATIDVSAASAQVTNFGHFINIKVTSPFMGSTVTEYASELKSAQKKSPYSAGDARYPTYEFSAGIIAIKPTDAVSCVLEYFTTPVFIDITDNSTQITYNQHMIDLLLYECMVQSGVDSRDAAAIQLGQQQEQLNQ